MIFDFDSNFANEPCSSNGVKCLFSEPNRSEAIMSIQIRMQGDLLLSRCKCSALSLVGVVALSWNFQLPHFKFCRSRILNNDDVRGANVTISQTKDKNAVQYNCSCVNQVKG